MPEITTIQLGTPGPSGAGITAAQWAALQAIVASATTGIINAPASLNVVGDTDLGGNNNLGNQVADIVQVWGHFKHKSAAPTIAVGAAVGTGGSVGATISGTDQAGLIAITAGTTTLTTGILATITYNTARPNTNVAITLTPRGTTAGVNAVQVYYTAPNTTTWDIRCNVAPGSGNTLSYSYHVFEFTN